MSSVHCLHGEGETMSRADRFLGEEGLVHAIDSEYQNWTNCNAACCQCRFGENARCTGEDVWCPCIDHSSPKSAASGCEITCLTCLVTMD
jgi:hypothetical protein